MRPWLSRLLFEEIIPSVQFLVARVLIAVSSTTLVGISTIVTASSFSEYESPSLPAAHIPLKKATLDKATREILETISKNPMDITKLSIDEVRKAHQSFFLPIGVAPTKLTSVEERFIPGPSSNIRVRVYTPLGIRGALPVLVYYHGGGMNSGTLEQYEPLCQQIAHQANVIVVSVDYRLAPENKFPAAVDDAYASLLWARANAASYGGDSGRMAVGGDSAGGNLAAVVAQLNRDQKGTQLAFQLLLYPAVGTRGNSRTINSFAKDYLFGKDELSWAYSLYLDSPSQLNDPRVSPIKASSFASLPPAFVLSAEYEIMRDDIEEYARLLKRAGVPTTLKRYRHTVHPFLSMAGKIPTGAQAIADCAAALKRALHNPSRKPY